MAKYNFEGLNKYMSDTVQSASNSVRQFQEDIKELPKSTRIIIYTAAAVSLIVPIPGATMAVAAGAKVILKKRKNTLEILNITTNTTENTNNTSQTYKLRESSKEEIIYIIKFHPENKNPE